MMVNRLHFQILEMQRLLKQLTKTELLLLSIQFEVENVVDDLSGVNNMNVSFRSIDPLTQEHIEYGQPGYLNSGTMIYPTNEELVDGYFSKQIIIPTVPEVPVIYDISYAYIFDNANNHSTFNAYTGEKYGIDPIYYNVFRRPRCCIERDFDVVQIGAYTGSQLIRWFSIRFSRLCVIQQSKFNIFN